MPFQSGGFQLILKQLVHLGNSRRIIHLYQDPNGFVLPFLDTNSFDGQGRNGMNVDLARNLFKKFPEDVLFQITWRSAAEFKKLVEKENDQCKTMLSELNSLKKK